RHRSGACAADAGPGRPGRGREQGRTALPLPVEGIAPGGAFRPVRRAAQGVHRGAKGGLSEADEAREVKACIVGMLRNESRSKEMGAALLAAAANDLALLESIRRC